MSDSAGSGSGLSAAEKQNSIQALVHDLKSGAISKAELFQKLSKLQKPGGSISSERFDAYSIELI